MHGCTQTAYLHAGFPYALSLHPIPQWAALEGCTAVALMAEHDDARQNDNNRAGSVHGCSQSACLHAVFPTPYPTVGGTGRSALMAEHDDARQASRQCARTCSAGRAGGAHSRRSLRLRIQWGFSRIRKSSRHQAQARNTLVKCEVAAAILASEGPAPVSVGRHARSSCDFAQHVNRHGHMCIFSLRVVFLIEN